MTHDDTPDLVQRALAGESRAFAALFERGHLQLLNYLYHTLGDRAAAEDIAQEAYVRAYERLQQLGPPWDFKSWLFRIAGNLAMDYLRREKRFVEEGGVVDDGERPTSPRPVEALVERRSARQLVWATLGLMPSAYRQAIVLRDLIGLSYEEMAVALERSYANTRLLVHRARLRFRDLHEKPAAATPGCAQLVDLISAYHDGELDAQDRTRVEAHVQVCAECRETRRALARVGLAIAALPPLTPSEFWVTETLKLFRKVPTPKGRPERNPPEERDVPADASAGRGGEGAAPQSGVPSAPKGVSDSAASAPGWVMPRLRMGLLGVGAFALVLFALTGGFIFARRLMTLRSPAATSTPATGARLMEATPTLPPLPTEAATQESPVAVALDDTNCRRGPDPTFAVVAAVGSGRTLAIDGRNSDGTWLWLHPSADDEGCWVWAGALYIHGDLAGLPLVAPPGAPDSNGEAAPACWVWNPNLQQNVCTSPCPPNAQPGGTCAQ